MLVIAIDGAVDEIVAALALATFRYTIRDDATKTAAPARGLSPAVRTTRVARPRPHSAALRRASFVNRV